MPCPDAGRPVDRFVRPGAPRPHGDQRRPAQVIVIDGETLRLGTTIIRLSGLAAPARGQACAAGPDCGSQASAALAGLVKDQTVKCQIAEHDPGEHLSGRCMAGGRDINAALVETGWARALSHDLDAMHRRCAGP